MTRCYVINLDEDAARWQSVSGRLKAFKQVEAVRVPGVPGGVVGCTRAHLAAWNRIAAGQDAFALVLEDDSNPCSLGMLDGWAVPGPYDFVFCNSRMTSGELAYCGALFVKSLGTFLPWHSAVGSDGYIVTRAGAGKLVTLFKRDGLGSHVDLRLYAYGSRPNFPGIPRTNPHYPQLRHLPADELNVGVLSWPLTNHNNSAPSSIRKTFS